MIHSTSFIAPSASIMGSVTLEAESSVWYQAVLRGDLTPITVGAQSNIQDNAVVHVDEGLPCTVGRQVAIEHRIILHSCVVEDDCLIKMGSVLLNRVRISTKNVIT